MSENASVTIGTKALRDALKQAAPFSAKRHPLFAYTHLLLRSFPGELLEIMATDGEHSIRLSLPGESAGGFAVCAPAQALKKLIDATKDTSVTLEERTGGGITVYAGGHTSTLHAMPAEDFPVVLSPPEEEEILSMDAGAFGGLVASVAVAASKDDTRPMLTGVLFETAEGTVTATATDAYRLATKTVPARSSAGRTLVLPASALKRIATSLEGRAGRVTLSHAPDSPVVTISLPGLVTTSRIVEGTYPTYRNIIPATSTGHARMEATEILESIKVAMAGARLLPRKAGRGEEAQIITLELTDPETVRFSSLDGDGNEFAARAAAHVDRWPFTIDLNPAYLAWAVTALVGGSPRRSTRARTAVHPLAPTQAIQTGAFDPVSAQARVVSARLRLGVIERIDGTESKRYKAAAATLVDAQLAQRRRQVVAPPAQTPAVQQRTPGPAADRTIELCFTRSENAVLIRLADGDGSTAHAIMPVSNARRSIREASAVAA